MERSKIIKEELSGYEGKMFLYYQQSEGQAVNKMVKQTYENGGI